MTVVDRPAVGASAADIVPGDVSGGTNKSHTLVVSALTSLLEVVPADAPQSTYEEAVLKANALGKDTDGARSAPIATCASSTCCAPTPCSFGRCPGRRVSDRPPDDPLGPRFRSRGVPSQGLLVVPKRAFATAHQMEAALSGIRNGGQ